MLIVELYGGLGNQLQQYALYEKLAALGKEVRLDAGWFSSNQAVYRKRELELAYFPGAGYRLCTREEREALTGPNTLLNRVGRRLGIAPAAQYREHKMYDEALFSLDNRILSGYWACEAYYADILPELRKKLVFPPSPNPENRRMEESIGQRASVSLHLRQGDYPKPENQKLFGGITTFAYYARAIRYMKEKLRQPHFFVFSDDPAFAREFAGKTWDAGEYTVVDVNHGKDSFYDMWLMSRCRAHICANSTFSFWGARLNGREDRIAVRPLKQKNGVDWYEPAAMKRLWPGWVFIDEEGRDVD